MKARANDWRQIQNDIKDNNEFDNYTEAQWCSWYDTWNTYVKSGGVRPPTRPPI